MNYKEAIVEIKQKGFMTARGFIRTHKIRAVKSKSEDVRAKSQDILEGALAQEKVLIPQLKRLHEKGVTFKKITTKTKTKATFPSRLIEQTNKAYKDANGVELGLTQNHIVNIENDGGDYKLKVK